MGSYAQNNKRFGTRKAFPFVALGAVGGGVPGRSISEE